MQGKRGTSEGSVRQRRARASSENSAFVPLSATGHDSAFASADILSETVDQAVHHFLSALRQHNIVGVTQAAVFINQSLVEAAERNLAAERYARRVCANQGDTSVAAEQLQQMYAALPSPSLSQWLSSLEALTVAALPAALPFMQRLHNTQPVRFSAVRTGGLVGASEETSEQAKASLKAAEQCISVLINLCFFAVVTFRRIETSMHLWCALHASDGNRAELVARFIYSGGGARDLLNRITLERHLEQLREIAIGLRGCFTPYMPLLVFSADQQLWSIKEEGSVSVTGHPCLHQLPAVPVYLAQEDGWVWLLAAVCLHVMGPANYPTVNDGDAKTTAGEAVSSRQQHGRPDVLQGKRNSRNCGGGVSRGSSLHFSPTPPSRKRWSGGNPGAQPYSVDTSSLPPSPHSTVGMGVGPHSAPHTIAALEMSVSHSPPPKGTTAAVTTSLPSLRSLHPPSSYFPSVTSHALKDAQLRTTAATSGTSFGHLRDEEENSEHADSVTPTRSPLATFLTTIADDPVNGGKDYAAKFVSIILSTLCLFVKLWLRQRTLPSYVIDVWRRRGAKFPTAGVTGSMLSQFKHEMEDTSTCSLDGDGLFTSLAFSPPIANSVSTHQHTTMDDVSFAMNCVADLVTHIPALFVHGSANLMELLRILSTVAPVQLFHAVSARQNQPVHEVVKEVERGATRQRRIVPLRFAWKPVERFANAVTRLFRASSDRVFALALSSPATVNGLVPPDACTMILTLGCAHVFCESVLAPREKSSHGHTGAPEGNTTETPLPAPSALTAAAIAAGVLGSPAAMANDQLMRALWASWGRWISLAFAVYMANDSDRSVNCRVTPSSTDWVTFTDGEEFPRYCAGFAQSFGAALEDIFSLTVVIKSTKSGVSDGVDPFLLGSVDVVGSLAVRRLRHLLYLLNDAATAVRDAGLNAVKTGAVPRNYKAAVGVIPFSCLTEESLNAIAFLLQRYEQALSNPGELPGHRQYWLLAVGHLRLSSVDACCTSEAHKCRGRGRGNPLAAFEGISDFVCAGPRDSVPFLRDRTYENYDEWLKKEAENLKLIRRKAQDSGWRTDLPAPLSPNLRGSSAMDPFQLLRMEVKDGCDVLRERLLMSSARFLCVALRLAATLELSTKDELSSGSVEARSEGARATNSSREVSSPSVSHDASAPPPAAIFGGSRRSRSPAAQTADGILAAGSQAKVYVDAFTRFLLMMDWISSNRLMSCLRTFQDELRATERRNTHAGNPLPQTTGNTVGDSANTPLHAPSPFLISAADVNAANLFEMEVSLFTI